MINNNGYTISNIKTILSRRLTSTIIINEEISWKKNSKNIFNSMDVSGKVEQTDCNI